MSILIDIEQRSICFSRSRLQSLFGLESFDFAQDLLSCVCWPQSEWAEFWVDEMSTIASRAFAQAGRHRAPVEYFFDHMAYYCNNPKLFYLCGGDVRTFWEGVMCDSERNIRTHHMWYDPTRCYGAARQLEFEQCVYAVWIFYRLLDPYGRYTHAELKSLIGKWLDVIRRDPAEWEARSGVPRSDVRFFTEIKKYRWHLNL